jgi:hypothetical protein
MVSEESEKEVRGYMWPVMDGCSSVVIKKFAKAVDQRDGVPPVSQSVVTLPDDIEHIFALMHSMPTTGDEFQSFGDGIEVIYITFMYSLLSGVASEDSVGIYGGSVQLPDTTFSSGGSESETLFITLIEGFLQNDK